MLLLELHSAVGFAHAPTDAKLVDNWVSCCDSRYQPPSTQGGADPKPLSSSLVPTHLYSAGRLEMFLPGLGSQSGLVPPWPCRPAAWGCRLTGRGCPQVWEQELISSLAVSRRPAGRGLSAAAGPREPVHTRRPSRWLRGCCRAGSSQHAWSSAGDRLLAMAAMRSPGYGGTAEARP